MAVEPDDCFRDDTDRLVYLSNLRDLAVQAKCALHAYCLMTNHVHLLLTPSADAYLWSSHTGNTGRVRNQLLTPHVEYLALSERDDARLAAYRDLFAHADAPAFLTASREATYGGLPLVGKELKAKLVAETAHPLEHRKPGPKKECEPQRDRITADLGF